MAAITRRVIHTFKQGIGLISEQNIHERDIAAITGHEIERTRRVLETYLPRNRGMAARAAEVMVRYHTGLTPELPLATT